MYTHPPRGFKHQEVYLNFLYYLCRRQKFPEIARAVHLTANDYLCKRQKFPELARAVHPGASWGPGALLHTQKYAFYKQKYASFNVSDYLKSGVKICPTPVTRFPSTSQTT